MPSFEWFARAFLALILIIVLFIVLLRVLEHL